MLYHIMIPARYGSQRLPGKLLLDLNGKTILQHTFENCKKTSASTITILTDDQRIREVALSFGAQVMMTSTDCQSGTDRIIEAIHQSGFSSEAIIVNVQGDEPRIHPVLIEQVAACITEKNTSMATLAFPISNTADVHNPNVVKAVRNREGFAEYFSRSPIQNAPGEYLRHIGLYAYQAGFLLKMAGLPAAPTQLAESLEQLKVLWYGEKIYLDIAKVMPEQDINTVDDYEKLKELIHHT